MTNKKLGFVEWISKYFNKEYGHTYWTSNYERQVIGFSSSDQSHYNKNNLKREWKLYLKDQNDFNKYQESTNERVMH